MLPQKIAVLLTCFNRRERTKKSLENLFSQTLPEGLSLEVFLCDDGSSDGTKEMLEKEFPQVNIVQGNGSLFWGGGMRKAWESAIKKDKYDFFLWLNDDTFMFKDALKNLFKEYYSKTEPFILTAACKRPGTNITSYGGSSEEGIISPNGTLQKVIYINGNLVLIPNEIVEKIGMVSEKYTHYLGDYDYGLRAQKAGFSCYVTSDFLAECEINSIPYWGDPNLSLKERWKMAHDIKGLAISEYVTYKKHHHGSLVGFKTWLDSYLKVLSPHHYIKLRNFLKRNLSSK